MNLQPKDLDDIIDIYAEHPNAPTDIEQSDDESREEEREAEEVDKPEDS